MPPDGRSLLAMSVLIFLALWPKTPQPAQVAAPYSSPYLTGSTTLRRSRHSPLRPLAIAASAVIASSTDPYDWLASL